MRNPLTYQQYLSCLKEILFKTFEDKRMIFHFLLGLLVLVVGTLATLTIPLVLKMAVDSFSTANTLMIPLILISYGMLWMVSQAFHHIRALLTYKVEQRITCVLGIKVLSHLFNLPQRYFLNQKPGAITNVIRRAQRDVPSIIVGVFFHLLPTTLEFLCVILLTFYLYPPLYSLLLGGTLIVFFLYTFLSMKTVMHDRQIANDVDKQTDGIVTDWLSNHEAIKTFGQNTLAIKTCEKELKRREEAEVRFMTKFSLVDLGQSFILGVGLISLTYFVGQGVLNKTLSIGDFVLFNGYILQFILPISILGQVAQDIRKALVDMKGIIDILLTKNEIQEVSHPQHLTGNRFHIEFKNVTFAYNDRQILKGISFTINPGETVLVVGPTGVGKSTIAKLLLRLYDPSDGNIFINQLNIKQYSFQSLYNTLGWVPQESYLLNDTIQNNICFVRPEATLQDIEIALDHAGLLEFIKKLPEGLDTQVGDRGLKLSGGEKQRLAIARLFLKKPKICIFDEATSFLDKNTELVIQKNIESFLPDMMKIIITHRPFMVEKADQIITLEKGKISLKSSKAHSRKSFIPANRFKFINQQNKILR